MAPQSCWIFAYGSLMWDPGFPFVERAHALLHGYHRAMCIYSHVWRGTPERPGLVLGLDRGGACRGIAFRVEPEARAEVIAYLDARERVTDVYLRREQPVRLAGGAGPVTALAYVADRAHRQYAGKLAPEEAARLIAQGVGRAGANVDYLASTVRHLEEMGIADGPLHRLERTVANIRRAG